MARSILVLRLKTARTWRVQCTDAKPPKDDGGTAITIEAIVGDLSDKMDLTMGQPITSLALERDGGGLLDLVKLLFSHQLCVKTRALLTS